MNVVSRVGVRNLSLIRGSNSAGWELCGLGLGLGSEMYCSGSGLEVGRTSPKVTTISSLVKSRISECTRVSEVWHPKNYHCGHSGEELGVKGMITSGVAVMGLRLALGVF